MAATVRGALTVDLPSSALEPARRALARAVASGALGPGFAVTVDGDAVVFDGAPRSDGPAAGRVTLHSDGRATYALQLGGAERARVAQSAGLAALVSAVSTLLWSWQVYTALPVGGAVGLAWAIARLVGDRRRARRHLQALLRSLPLLVDAGS